ncbi:alpha/beta hydrolase [Marinobacterium sp. D7]|uniref:alpha/beta fold hydrolase n=1 Tax=Marinobacterium ramblicola TaxID=2849041 RepID=UPI001C2CD14D|nr:alpha/beta hydrolase [Marinobacterium ramblicola]MBV1789955.1 alpha/beta hydrolase [Marinobacterium ramblicola]
MSETSGLFRSGDLQLHYLRWGDLTGIPVVMLHGLRGFAATWESLADALGEGYCCYGLDQRGRGESDWGPVEGYQTATYVQDLERFVDHLGLDRFVLIGHSLGGTNALEYVRRHPERVTRLVIEDIGPGSSNRGEGAERIRREMRNTPLTFASWEEAEAFWRFSRPNLTEEALQARLQNSFRERDGKIGWKHDQLGIAEARLTFEPIDLWPAVKAVKCPALLVKGGDSDFLPRATVQEILTSNQAFSAVEVDNASHYVHDDQPDVFNKAVVDFIQAGYN